MIIFLKGSQSHHHCDSHQGQNKEKTPLQYSWASLVAQLVKNPPAKQETWVQSLGWEEPLEKGMATHSSILPGKSHGEDPGGLQSMESKRVGHD